MSLGFDGWMAIPYILRYFEFEDIVLRGGFGDGSGKGIGIKGMGVGRQSMSEGRGK